MRETGKEKPGGDLWAKLVARTRLAQQHGHQQPIPTHGESLMDGGLPVFLRVVENLGRKDNQPEHLPRVTTNEQHPLSPFLPPEEDLFVADISPTHFSVLNKFNVLDHHLLIVTKEFEEQDCLLNSADFDALWICLRAFPSLGFYNGGEEAGASQRHKHLQIIPVDPQNPNHSAPWLPLMTRHAKKGEVTELPELPFQHALIGLENVAIEKPGTLLRDAYHTLLKHTGCNEAPETAVRQKKPYNLLMTTDWMLMVPRSHERWHDISINALGYIGALLVRDENQAQDLKTHGPLQALAFAGLPRIKP
ncbi:MAG: hypothetical protein Kow006_27890 [Gammaproteobacteria bacterium]